MNDIQLEWYPTNQLNDNQLIRYVIPDILIIWLIIYLMTYFQIHDTQLIRYHITSLTDTTYQIYDTWLLRWVIHSLPITDTEMIGYLIPNLSDNQYPTYQISEKQLIQYLIPNLSDTWYQTFQKHKDQLLSPNTQLKSCKMWICKRGYCSYANENFADLLRKMIVNRVFFFFLSSNLPFI